MNDGIPSGPDPLRYGGDVRESGSPFWIDLLDEFGCLYILAPNGSHEEQATFF